ncbi:DUF2971 domain-containing protein [Neptuniibacter caesariensis]|uniref:DUF2971 domain-containing protein n=1 Tax=Neptuniibacter caesariensis TaxID=207954 RepID=A0A7U8C5T4_NEPCE|nr:DUF2971 domain-containing protein [Neptuniibacter caesariensis]EAR62048.1 hypothetical protein MED92_10094 [Oceanospirillum sp. MED92] [Neptuniibacter caesariensis]
MEDLHIKALSIFDPYLLEKENQASQQDFRFVQYTNAEAAMRIIQNREVWLRNVQCMNDYREIDHGFECLISAYKSENGLRLSNQVNEIFPDLMKEIEELIDGWFPHLQQETYITCVSEHPDDENEYGRLSMWRAYGGDQPVALIINGESIQLEDAVFNASTYPVKYLDPEDLIEEFGLLCARFASNRSTIDALGRENVKSYLFELFKSYSLCIKHPGFNEEREWRIVYNPQLNPSELVESSIESVRGIPQEIYKLPLKDIEEAHYTTGKVSDVIQGIIIGPTEHQDFLKKTFIKILSEAGCNEPSSLVHVSGIPLR